MDYTVVTVQQQTIGHMASHISMGCARVHACGGALVYICRCMCHQRFMSGQTGQTACDRHKGVSMEGESSGRVFVCFQIVLYVES